MYLGTTLTNQNSIQEDKILLRRKFRADWSEGVPVIIRCRIFCRTVCYPKFL